MKKIISILVASLMILTVGLSLAEEPVVGGWTLAEDIVITDEQQAAFDKAMDRLLGVDYTALIYLGSQVVAGTNHCFLCRATVVYPDAVPQYMLVYIYEDLEGNAEILSIVDFDISEMAVNG